MMKFWLSLTLAIAGGCGCNTSNTDNTPLEANRDQRIDALAKAACKRYEACNGYGSGANQKYTSEAICRADYTTKAANAWPIEECGNGRINNANFIACEESTKQVACTGDAWDGLVALGKCTSSKVCTDPAQ